MNIFHAFIQSCCHKTKAVLGRKAQEHKHTGMQIKKKGRYTKTSTIIHHRQALLKEEEEERKKRAWKIPPPHIQAQAQAHTYTNTHTLSLTHTPSYAYLCSQEKRSDMYGGYVQ